MNNHKNQVQLIGNAGQELELRKTSTGKSVVTFNMATNEYYKDAAGNKVEKTEWHTVVAWEQLADFLCKYCKKGTMLLVNGKLTHRVYDDKSGIKRYVTEILANETLLMDPFKYKTESTTPQTPAL